MTQALSRGEALVALRRAMQQACVSACLIPSADPHLSEYLPAYWQIRQWLTGFTGSVGTVVVTQDFAGIWVDSRYWVQAEAELAGSGVTLMKIGVATDPAHAAWLAEHVPPGGVVAVDGRALGLAAREALMEQFAAHQIRLDLSLDLPGLCWLDRPALPSAPVRDLPVEIAGQSRQEKLARVRTEMVARGAQWHLVSTLDDIAWLLNLRGEDVSFNPVFLAHVLIGPERVWLFVLPGKIDAALAQELALDGIEVRPYHDAGQALAELDQDARLLFDPARTTCALIDRVPCELVRAINPSTFFKSQKTPFELGHVRRVMEDDGAALCAFFAWLEDAIARCAQTPLNELMIDEQLLAQRSRQPGFISRSFGTIAAYNANGAMPHYRATPQSFATIAGDGLLLIDSGGQYVGGTTDITRVVPVGQPTAAQKDDYTAVLRAMIALSRLRFPRGVASPMLDAVARAPLWERLAEYGHGTGHGVGYYLNVHEGPQVISYRAAPGPHTAMQPGMITSNEPGLYRPGRWGIRIENLVCNVSAGTSEFGEFLEFETLTLCPIDTRCIQRAQLRQDEVDWLNAYHAEVRRRLAPKVSGPALAWLLHRTEPMH
ncbi:aminopeptidase P family protein [Zwartia panacis]|uniref:aminopeptidase P family protein n=1 Tax=Zwartia panacis TaxID=2683345 RepID=UPI0025B2B81E|nr:aminopeptidase P family protein [Zwartia panacis]MDN4016592.1 aminopeptidase P family protein [Zwartia panacis]